MVYKNYEILSGDTVVAVWGNNQLTVLNEALLPLYLKKIKMQICGLKPVP